MSQIMQVLFAIRCDGCGKTTGGLFPLMNAAEAQAERLGWEVGRDLKHLCPDCLKKRDAA